MLPRARISAALLGAALFLAGFLNDPPWKGYYRQQFFGIQSEPLRVARNIASEGEFANPFAILPTGPTAHVAPAYPYIAGALVKVFGETPNGWLAVRLLATAALSLQFALLPWIARVLGLSMWTGVLAAAFGILVKPAKEELWESHIVGLLAMLLTAAMFRRDRRAAVLAGVSFLVQPVLAGVYYVWVLAQKQRVWLALIPIAIVLPWMVRNFAVLGGFTFIRDDLGVELAVSFNDCAPYGIRESEKTGCFLEQHPNTSLEQAQALREEGEIPYNRRRLREGASWIVRHPFASLSLIAQRTWFFWFPSDFGFAHYSKQRKRMLFGHAITLLSFAGVFIAWKRGVRILALWLAVYPLVYYLMQFEERYRYPVLWITWLLAACVFEPLYSRRNDDQA